MNSLRIMRSWPPVLRPRRRKAERDSRAGPEHRSRLERIWADGKYNNRRLDRWLAKAKVGYRIEVIGRPAGSVGRWIARVRR